MMTYFDSILRRWQGIIAFSEKAEIGTAPDEGQREVATSELPSNKMREEYPFIIKEISSIDCPCNLAKWFDDSRTCVRTLDSQTS